MPGRHFTISSGRSAPPPGRRSLGEHGPIQPGPAVGDATQAHGGGRHAARGATIAVTGATGFLGRYLADELLRRGARVVGVVRNPTALPELRERGVELRRADLADWDRLEAGFRGATPWSRTRRSSRFGSAGPIRADERGGTVTSASRRRRPEFGDRVRLVRQRLPGRRQPVLDEDHPSTGRGPAATPQRLLALEGARGTGGASSRRRTRSISRSCAQGQLRRVRRQLHAGVRALMWPKLTLIPRFSDCRRVRRRRRRGGRFALEKPASMVGLHITGEDRRAWTSRAPGGRPRP